MTGKQHMMSVQEYAGIRGYESDMRPEHGVLSPGGRIDE